MMRYVIWGITILYAALSAIAAIIQIQGKSEERRDAPAIMLGGVLLLLLTFALPNVDWMMAAAGGVCIGIAAFLNGKRSGNFHAHHHVIRAVLTVLLAVGFYVW